MNWWNKSNVGFINIWLLSTHLTEPSTQQEDEGHCFKSFDFSHPSNQLQNIATWPPLTPAPYLSQSSNMFLSLHSTFRGSHFVSLSSNFSSSFFVRCELHEWEQKVTNKHDCIGEHNANHRTEGKQSDVKLRKPFNSPQEKILAKTQITTPYK